MKKLLALILTLVIALSLTACGGETEEEPAPEDENPATEEDAGGEDRVFKVGVCTRAFSSPWQTYCYDVMRSLAEEHPDIELDFQDGQEDANVQVNILQTFIEQEKDLVVVFANQTDTLTAAVNQVVDAGIPVINTQGYVGDGANILTFVGCDDYDNGWGQGQVLHELLEKDGKTETATLHKAPYIAQANGVYSTMVPVRFVSEAWGTTVLWDDDHRTVVLADTAGLIAEMDQNFTVFNQILQAQQQTFAGKKLVQTMQATGQLTLYDEAGKATDYAVSADAKTYSDGKAQRMQATLNMESALKALAKSHPEILDQVQVSLGTLLRTDLKRIPVDFLVDETGGCYLSTPLLHLFFPQLFAEASWFHVTDLDPTILSLAQKGGSIGEILSQSVASVSPFDYYDTLAQSAKAMSALFRDDLAQKGGNTYTWKLNNAVLNGLLGITDGALEDTMVLDGFLTTDTKGNATVQLSMDLKTGNQPQERIGLRFRLTQSTSTTSTLPSLTLPEGADVQEFMGVGSVL